MSVIIWGLVTEILMRTYLEKCGWVKGSWINKNPTSTWVRNLECCILELTEEHEVSLAHLRMSSPLQILLTAKEVLPKPENIPWLPELCKFLSFLKSSFSFSRKQRFSFEERTHDRWLKWAFRKVIRLQGWNFWNGTWIFIEKSLENTLDFYTVKMKSYETTCESGSEPCLDTESLSILVLDYHLLNCDKFLLSQRYPFSCILLHFPK